MSQVSFELPVRVYVEDTDYGGLVYHTNYIKYMERARSELLRECGVHLMDLAAKQQYAVIHSLEVKFLRAAKLEDELYVNAVINEMNNTRVIFEQSVYSAADKNYVYCTGTVRIVFVDEKTRPIRLPQEIREFLT